MTAKLTNKSGLNASSALKKATDKYLKELDDENFKSVTIASIFVEGEAKRNIRDYKSSEDKLIDTARLLNSLTHEVFRALNKVIGLVGTNVNYGPFHELGTQDIPARPFLRPALTDNTKKVKELLTKGVNNAARKVDKS